jgi:hypothetical protein
MVRQKVIFLITEVHILMIKLDGKSNNILQRVPLLAPEKKGSYNMLHVF